MTKVYERDGRYKNKPEAIKALKEGKRLRHCALTHDALGTSKVKVLFHDENCNEYAYWMDHATYDAIPLGEMATPEDYQRFGFLVESTDTDIYSNQ